MAMTRQGVPPSTLTPVQGGAATEHAQHVLSDQTALEAELARVEADLATDEALIAARNSAKITLVGNATATTLTTQNTWYPIAGTWTEDITPQGFTTALTAGGSITALQACRVIVAATISYQTSDAAETLEFALFRNGMLMTDEHVTTWADSTTYPNSVTLTSVIELAANDTIVLKARCTTNGSATLTFSNCNFSMA